MCIKGLERAIDLIFNPGGANRQETEELIKAISISTENASPETREYAENLIQRLKLGYEEQTGEKYD